MKNILVLMHDDVGQEARFQAALDLTRALEGHLTCLDVAIAPATVDDYATLGGSALLLADEQANESRNRERMEARLKVEGLPYDWVESTGFASAAVIEASGLADLIVLNRRIKNAYPDMEEIAGEVVVKSGRPVIVVPENCERFDAFGPALVAWDGSAEAQAALRAAVPLLRHASEVTILEIDDGSVRMPGEAAATYLSRHGIEPVLLYVRNSVQPASTTLLDQVERRACAYVVMGGYGHARLTEALFGGVTRRMLQESPVPVFLAH